MSLAETAAAQTQVFVQWPLKRNNADSTAVRQPATGMTVGTPTLRNYVLSNGLANVVPSTGVATAAYAPYSSVGQAFSTSATGAGGSTAISSGPKRGYFEQFTITNSGTAALRVDSLIFSVQTANSANGRAALSYSLNGVTTTRFTTDSIDFAGGKGPSGVLPATGNGSFGAASSTQAAVNPIVIPQFSTTATARSTTFRMAFVSGGTGLSIPAGRTLAVRMYFRVGSDTEGRYFLLRDVILKSQQAVVSASRTALQTNLSVYPNPTQNQLNVPHAAASRDARVTVFGTTGAKVAAFAVQSGSTETAVDLNALPKGLYLVEYADGTLRSSARIVKE
ncbi:T9SS type A sorting domain-containing protein [Hymenobacter convexus]|uniref:T9SS type A sorting domain-containing protein n=1 Tax=Hymenobacter sp. CA1UV-4 TaxID=3063782 RepID=UPI002712F359|nr:T9SS type A sorting domain-containing protein [Hymenobacter sp. CA1UV-4]MDO7853990.1 T9SS type A sorting domain-containing protein [Hymenobacter sp. CA1UV-4]